jgi:hypothetical protein
LLLAVIFTVIVPNGMISLLAIRFSIRFDYPLARVTAALNEQSVRPIKFCQLIKGYDCLGFHVRFHTRG